MPAYRVDTDKMHEAYSAMRTYSGRLQNCREDIDRVIAVLREEQPLGELCEEITVIAEIVSDCASRQLKLADSLNNIAFLYSEYENYIR